MKLNDVLCAINALKSKFGEFLVTDKMIKLTSNDNLVVWYNEKFESNTVQLPLSKDGDMKNSNNEHIMVQNVIEVFRKCVNKEFSINSIIQSEVIKTLDEFRVIVKRRIEEI